MRSALAALLTLLVVIAGVVRPSVLVRADEFSEFRIPDHRVSGWDGALNASGNHVYSGFPYQQTRQSQLSGNAGSGLFWRSEGDSRSTSLNLQTQALAARSHGERRVLSVLGGLAQESQSQQTDRLTNEAWFADVSTRRYPWSMPLGVSIDVTGQGTYAQRWSVNDDHSRTTDPTGTPSTVDQIIQINQNAYFQSHRVSGTLALGMGKVRDATGVYEALVIERRLRDRGVIRGRLAAATRQRIAELLYVRYDVLSTVSRPARRMWDELEQILRDDAAVDSDELNAESIQRAGEGLFDRATTRDALPVSPLSRQRGAFVGGAVQASHLRFMSWGNHETYSRFALDDSVVSEFRSSFPDSREADHDAVWAGPVGEWHRPIGPRVQLDVASRALFALTGENGRMDLISSGTLGAIVADRWLASVYGAHRRWIGTETELGDDTGDGWLVQYGASIRYFVEDHLSVELSANEMQQHLDSPPVFVIFDPPACFAEAAT